MDGDLFTEDGGRDFVPHITKRRQRRAAVGRGQQGWVVVADDYWPQEWAVGDDGRWWGTARVGGLLSAGCGGQHGPVSGH